MLTEDDARTITEIADKVQGWNTVHTSYAALTTMRDMYGFTVRVTMHPENKVTVVELRKELPNKTHYVGIGCASSSYQENLGEPIVNALRDIAKAIRERTSETENV